MPDNTTPNPFDAAAAKAAADTNAALSGEAARIKPIAQDALKKMLPSIQEQKTLDDLVKTVNQATNHNDQVAALTANIEKFGGVIVSLLRNAR